MNDIEALARASAAAFGLPVAEADWPGVTKSFAAILAAAAALEPQEVGPAEIPEVAPVFRP